MKRFTLAVTATALSATAVFAAVDVATLDTDGDSFVSRAEMAVAYPMLEDLFFDDIDSNDDSRISADEITTGEAVAILERAANIEAGGLMADTDGDNFVTYEELMVVFPGFMRTSFDDLDTNDDARLGPDELNAPDAKNLLAQGSAMGQDVDMMDLDTDGDSFLSYAELAVAYPKFPENQFVDIDQNGDNRLDSSEFNDPDNRAMLNSY